VEIIDRASRNQSKPARASFVKRILSYAMLLIIPIVIFTLLLIVARWK
jgi:t-SNARE complex subunit (syntaxin)